MFDLRYRITFGYVVWELLRLPPGLFLFITNKNI